MSPKILLDEMPEAIRSAIDQLLCAVGCAQTLEDVEREGAMQLGFLLGLETAKRLRPIHIEALYLAFEEAVQAKLEGLGNPGDGSLTVSED